MKSTEMAANIWLGDVTTHQENYFAGAKQFKPATYGTDSFTDMPIQRDEFGAIDYTFYAVKARKIRANSAGLLFKAFAAYVIGFSAILFVMI